MPIRNDNLIELMFLQRIKYIGLAAEQTKQQNKNKEGEVDLVYSETKNSRRYKIHALK